MDNGLLLAYENTSFNVYKPKISIRIGVINKELDNLLFTNQCETYAFVTAYNPYSALKSHEENRKLNEALFRDLIDEYQLFEGEGVGEDISWEPEKSFLVLGITLDDAKAIGVKYSQNAIVFGIIGEKPELLVLVD
jgi:hypothetical protein